MSSQNDEVQPGNSLDDVNKELTKENFNMLISDESDTELAPQLSRRTANVESSRSSFLVALATSASQTH